MLTDNLLDVILIQPEAPTNDVNTSWRKFPIAGVTRLGSNVDVVCLRRCRKAGGAAASDEIPVVLPLPGDALQLSLGG